MTSLAGTVCSFLVAIIILVSVHEFGHFWVARKLGVKVLCFSIGFGKKLISRRDSQQTEYAFSLIPLGGYVRMLDEREAPVKSEERHLAFNNQSVYKRIAIVLAGPVANFILAIACFWFIYMAGIEGVAPVIGGVTPSSLAEDAGFQPGDEILAVNETQAITWQAVIISFMQHLGEEDPLQVVIQRGENRLNLSLALSDSLELGGEDFFKTLGFESISQTLPIIIGEVLPESAASKSHLTVGDTIIELNGKPILGWDRFVEVIQSSPDKVIIVTYLRAGERYQTEVTPTPELNELGETIGLLGIRMDAKEMLKKWIRVQQFGPIEAFLKASTHTYHLSMLTLKMIGRMIVGDSDLKNISGPISIARGAGQSFEGGIEYYLAFLGLISISLAVINLLPIPMLDGGHLCYYLAELVIGKPVSEEIQKIGVSIGTFILFCILGIALYNDLTGLVH